MQSRGFSPYTVPTRFTGRGTVPSADAVVVEAHRSRAGRGQLQQTSIGLFDEAEKSADERRRARIILCPTTGRAWSVRFLVSRRLLARCSIVFLIQVSFVTMSADALGRPCLLSAKIVS